jgi:hypothetical protein
LTFLEAVHVEFQDVAKSFLILRFTLTIGSSLDFREEVMRGFFWLAFEQAF